MRPEISERSFEELRTALIAAAVTGKIDVRLPAASRDAAQAGEGVT